MQMSQFQAFQCHYQAKEEKEGFCQAISIVSAPNNLEGPAMKPLLLVSLSIKRTNIIDWNLLPGSLRTLKNSIFWQDSTQLNMTQSDYLS